MYAIKKNLHQETFDGFWVKAVPEVVKQDLSSLSLPDLSYGFTMDCLLKSKSFALDTMRIFTEYTKHWKNVFKSQVE